MTLTLGQVRGKYDRVSLLYDLIEYPAEIMLFQKWRKNLLKDLKGDVLEIGVGTGKNLPYYNYKHISLTATDISRGMLKKAREKIKRFHYPVKLVLVAGDKLPFSDDTFDTIVNTFLLCSVPSQEEMLNEMKRVLKPAGKIYMLEHVLSKNRFLAFLENIHNPLTNFFMGVNINRDTVASIKRSGLIIKEEKNLAFHDIFKKIIAIKK